MQALRVLEADLVLVTYPHGCGHAQNKVAVITGATGGIGSAVAEMLSGTGYRMALSGSLGCHSPELSYVIAYNHKALRAAKSDTSFRRKFFTQMDNALLNGPLKGSVKNVADI
jgi:hypothetical protein